MPFKVVAGQREGRDSDLGNPVQDKTERDRHAGRAEKTHGKRVNLNQVAFNGFSPPVTFHRDAMAAP